MASINQYRGSTWRAIIRRKGFAPLSKTFARKSDAEAWVVKEEAKMGVSEYDPLHAKAARTATVRGLFERYADEVAAHMKGRNEEGTIRRLARDANFMPMLLTKISPRDIREWRDARVLEIQSQSVHRELGAISAVFTHAVKEWGVVAVNPCRGVARFKGADVSRKMRWNPEDTATFLKAAKWQEAKPPIKGREYVGWALLVAIETAMRIGELCLPTVADFHPEGKYVHLSDTKNGDQRNVPLSTTALRYLEALCKNKKPTDKIFPLKANTLGEYALDVRRACGLEHLVFHDTRHEAATRLSAKLANVLELSAVTGHRSLKSLQKYYHPDPADIAGKLG